MNAYTVSWVRGSAIGECAGYRAHLIPGPWFKFPAQATQALHPPEVGEWVADLSRKHKTL